MWGMFFRAGAKSTTFDLAELDNWDTSKVTNMSYMFFEAGFNATTWNIGNLDSWHT
jgi:hypothetical protein